MSDDAVADLLMELDSDVPKTITTTTTPKHVIDVSAPVTVKDKLGQQEAPINKEPESKLRTELPEEVAFTEAIMPTSNNAPVSSNLIDCEDCGRQISRRSSQCPNCGCPMQSEDYKNAEALKKKKEALKKKLEALKNRKKDQPLIVFGVVCSILSMFILPPVLGLLGVICGFMCLGKGHSAAGIVLIVCSCASAAMGIFMALYWS